MAVPTLYDWIGGIEPLRRLTAEFYRRVPDDPVLAPVFAHMAADHPEHVALFLAEVLGGPALYSREHGGHPEMLRHHLGRHLSETMRRRWIGLLLDTYTDLGLPADPEFASALVGYLEWGSRLAVINSAPGATVSEQHQCPNGAGAKPAAPIFPRPTSRGAAAPRTSSYPQSCRRPACAIPAPAPARGSWSRHRPTYPASRAAPPRRTSRSDRRR